MIIEEEKVEIVEDDKSVSTKEKKKKAKKEKANKANTTPVSENQTVNEENNNNESTEKNVSNQILEEFTSEEEAEAVEETNNKNEKKENSENDTNLTSSDDIHNSTTTESEESENFEVSSEEPQKKSKHPAVIFLIFLSIFLGILLIAFSGFALYNYNHRSVISKGIYINSIDVSNLSKEQAKEKLDSYYSEQLSNDIALVYNDYKSFIKPSEIELSYDIDSAVNYAYTYGKNGNIFQNNYYIFTTMINGLNLTPTYTLNEESLSKILTNISAELPDAIVESSYYIDGNTLIITKGNSGSVINLNSTVNSIKSKLVDLSYINNPITIDVVTQDPKKVDVDQIYNEVHKDPKDAYYTKDPYTIYPSENGVDFKISIDEAKQIVETAEKECEIPLKVLYPSVTTNMIGQEAFPDLLGTFSTHYVSNADRTTNLRLAAGKIDGTVLMPGEVFSYNSVVGERTIAAGYKSAAIYQDGQVVDGLGGGICQISSTLYNAALFANLEMVELYNHQFVPSYVTAGRDATVVYGVKDFKFKNSRDHAIKITCSVSGGIAKFNILGVKEPTEYDVSVYANVSRTSSYIKATTYRTLKLNGETIKTEKISNSTYKIH